MSKEHAWPRWLGAGMTVEPTQTTRKLGFERSAPDAYTEAPTIVTTKPGSALTARIREICTLCNSGWMSQLEQAAMPLLQRLWAPGYPLGVTLFRAEEVRTVAAWAIKTGWVRERVEPGPTTPTPAMRARFAVDRIPPQFSSVWIARHNGRTNFGAYVTQIEALHREHETLSGAPSRRVLICTLTFRGLSILVRTDDGWGVPQFQPPVDRWTMFWPKSDPVIWPAPAAVSDLDVFSVAAHFSTWMRLPDLPTFHRHPDGVQYRRRN